MSRISRKEAKAFAGPIQKQNVVLKRSVAVLKKRLAALERAANELRAAVGNLKGAQPAEAPEETGKARITAKGVRSLRRKLGLSQGDFGRLIGITNVAVSHWERRNGPLKVRNSTRAALLAIRGIGAREAKSRLAASATPAKRSKATKRR